MANTQYGILEDGSMVMLPGGGSGSGTAGIASAAFPDSFVTNSTTAAFCESIDNYAGTKVGMTFLGPVTLTDMPFYGNAEVIVRIMTEAPGAVIVLEMFSTNIDTNHWYAMYCGEMTTGDSDCPWQGIMSINGSNKLSGTKYEPVKDYQAASKKYVDDKVAGVTSAPVNVPLESVVINGMEPAIANKKQIFTVTTCAPIPDSVSGVKIVNGTRAPATTLQFCRDMVDREKGCCEIGMMYMSTVNLSDSPCPGQAELLVKVIGGDSANGKYVLELEFSSTNTRERCWVSMFNGSKYAKMTASAITQYAPAGVNANSWAYEQVAGGMQYGDSSCPWFARLMAVLPGYASAGHTVYEGCLEKDYRAATEKYVDTAVNTKQNTLSAGVGIKLTSNTITAPAFKSSVSLDSGGTVSVVGGTRYTISCDSVTLNVGDTTEECEVVVTLSDSATSPNIGLSNNLLYPDNMEIPEWEAGKSYLINIRNNIVLITGLHAPQK